MWSKKMISVLNIRCDKESVSPKIKFLKFRFLLYKIRIISLSKHVQVSAHPPDKTFSENISPTTCMTEPLEPHGGKRSPHSPSQ